MGINYFEHNLVLNISFNVKIQYLFELIIYHLFVFHIFTVSIALTGRSQVRISARDIGYANGSRGLPQASQ